MGGASNGAMSGLGSSSSGSYSSSSSAQGAGVGAAEHGTAKCKPAACGTPTVEPEIVPVKRAQNESIDHWLASLDTNGTMSQYLDTISMEFEDLSQIACVWNGDHKGRSIIEGVDVSFWEVARISKL